MAVGCVLICTQPVTSRQNRISSELTFIFNPFNGDDGDIKIPELVQETTQGRLVSKAAYQKGFTILLGDNGEVVQPMIEI